MADRPRWKFQRKAAPRKGVTWTDGGTSANRTIAFVRDGVPFNANRDRLLERPCLQCATPFMAPVSDDAKFCKVSCRTAYVVAQRQFAKENNPSWKGGVSKDNMRYNRRQAERWPERVAARKLVKQAVDSGKLVRQPCEVCGATPAEGHHDDYSKPLEVRWLCPTHHDAHHAEERRLARIKRIEAKRP